MPTTTPTTRPARPPRALLLLLLALAALPLSGCDNPACIFSGNCDDSGPSAGLGTKPASVPANGEVVLPGAPTIVNFFPKTPGVDTRTPIVIVFSEAMSPQNMNIAFEVFATGFGLVPFRHALIGDGRVLVMLPLTPLQPGVEHLIRFREGVTFQDRTGQEPDRPDDLEVGFFTTAAENAAVPRLVTTYPPDDASAVPGTSEIVTIFDRAMKAESFTESSYVVTADGVEPAFDPDPQPLPFLEGTAVVNDTRVWRWRSVDDDQQAVDLGTLVPVVLTLSPAGHPIQDTANASLPPTSVNYTTLPFLAPTGAAITSSPTDAIGIAQISGPADLALRVDLADAQEGDDLEVYVFGTKPDVAEAPPLIALRRVAPLVAPFTSFTWTAAELDLAAGAVAADARFADGSLAFAFQLLRGASRSGLRLLDVDLGEAGTQHPVLDTVAPTLVGLGLSGTALSSFRSDLRDVAIVGRASEPLRAVRVTTPLGTNEASPGVAPPVAGANAAGLFVAAPVELGLVPPASLPLAYDLEAYDRAFNPAPLVNGQFLQLGASGPGAALPGGTIAVEAFDESSLAAVAGATVSVHADVGGTVSFVASATTDANGRASVAAPASGEAIVTIDARATGYVLWTFDGVPTTRLSAPLELASLADASASGELASQEVLNAYQRRFADSRFKESAARLAPIGTCTADPIELENECPFGPVTIRARELGFESAVLVIEPETEFEYSALSYLRGFAVATPVGPVEPAATGTTVIDLPFLLDEPDTDPEERPIDVPAHVLDGAFHPGAVAPRITVEARAHGVRGPVVVGRGIAFEDDLFPGLWNVRAAYPGAADPIQDVPTDDLGSLVEEGTIDAELYLRAELVQGGVQAGARPRLSQTTFGLLPPAGAVLATPPAVQNPGLASLDVAFSDVLPDSVGEPGLYRVTLSDTGGTRWTIWRADPPDAAGPDVVVHAPFVGAGATFPLAPGTLRAQVSAFAWPDLDLAAFLWSDVAREQDLYSHAPRVPFTPP